MKKQKMSGDFKAALARLRAAAREEERDWQDAEWRAALRLATSGKPETQPAKTFPKRRLVWASAGAGLLLIGLAASHFLGLRRESIPFLAGSKVPLAEEFHEDQEMISMTLISPESGLRIYWYLKKNFQWEEGE